MTRQTVRRLVRRPAAIAGLALGLGAPAVLGAMLAHLGGFYPGTALSAALQTSGLLLAVLPCGVVALEAHRTRR